DAQSTGPSNPLCCTVQSDSVTGGMCGAPAKPASADGGSATPTMPKIDSLGVQAQCPAPADGWIEIEVPSAGATKGASLAVVKQEPKTGFLGACLAPYLSYVPTLPTVCYQVKSAGSSTFGQHSYTAVTAPAGIVFQSYSTLDTTLATANPDSYQVL